MPKRASSRKPSAFSVLVVLAGSDFGLAHPAEQLQGGGHPILDAQLAEQLVDVLNPKTEIDLEQEQTESTERSPWAEKLWNELPANSLSKLGRRRCDGAQTSSKSERTHVRCYGVLKMRHLTAFGLGQSPQAI